MQRAKNSEKNIEGKKGGLTLVNKKIYYKATKKDSGIDVKINQ